MNIITRKEALSKGLKIYFTGKPCKRGHIAEKNIHGRCLICRIDDNLRLNNLEYKKELNKEWRQKNPELIQQWKQNNPEYYKEYRKEYCKINSYKVNALESKRRISKLQQTPIWGNKEEIEKFYLESNIQTKLHNIQYDVDHIIPLRGKYVSGLHVENNLQVITHIDNIKKSNRYIIL